MRSMSRMASPSTPPTSRFEVFSCKAFGGSLEDFEGSGRGGGSLAPEQCDTKLGLWTPQRPFMSWVELALDWTWRLAKVAELDPEAEIEDKALETLWGGSARRASWAKDRPGACTILEDRLVDLSRLAMVAPLEGLDSFQELKGPGLV